MTDSVSSADEFRRDAVHRDVTVRRPRRTRRLPLGLLRQGYSPNLLPDRQGPDSVDEIWVADINYLPLRGDGFCYLAGFVDRYSRNVAGRSIAATMTESPGLDVPSRAIRDRRPGAGTIRHGDRGGQYAGPSHRGMSNRSGTVPEHEPGRQLAPRV